MKFTNSVFKLVTLIIFDFCLSLKINNLNLPTIIDEEQKIITNLNNYIFQKNSLLKSLKTKKDFFSNLNERKLSPYNYTFNSSYKSIIRPILAKGNKRDVPLNSSINYSNNTKKTKMIPPKNNRTNKKTNVQTNIQTTKKSNLLDKRTSEIKQLIKDNWINIKKELKNLNYTRIVEPDFFPSNNIQINDYSKIMKETASNANSKLSVPYFRILKKIKEILGNINAQKAKIEIQKLRSMDIDEVTDIILDYSEKIKNGIGDYWYYFYIVSNVVLRGKIIKGENNTEKIVNWKMKEPNTRILEKGKDEIYDFFVEKDEIYSESISYLRNLTLYELRNSLNGISTSEKLKNSVGIEMGVTILKDFDSYKTNITNIRFKEWIGPKERNSLIMLDFEQNQDFFNEIKQTYFYKLVRKFPKGIIHHFHFSAGFSMVSIDKGLNELVEKNYINKGIITVILEAGICQEDKTNPDSFLEISTPRFFIIEDFLGFYKNYTLRKYNEDYKNFKNNYILADGRCIINPLSSNVKINVNLKAYLFYKFCKDSIIYIKKDLIESFKEFNLSNVKPLETIINFLKVNSHILNRVTDLQMNYLPESYSNWLFSIRDQVSVAVWFKFEMIFNIYADLFENDFVCEYLKNKLYRDLLDQTVSGIEFRQSYDLNKNQSSRYAILSKSEGLEVSFILPGRKMKNGHKLDDLIRDLDKAKQDNDTKVLGFDFFGYEDDPYTGARNFLSASLNKLFDLNKDIKVENDFNKFLNALRRGHKLYLHAGETIYVPNYPVSKDFMKKFYINDNLIHTALLPNVERIGHGFALVNNELLMNVHKRKKISLEICPVSNQALQYYDVHENPIVKLLRSGLYATVSPDDPGFFNYFGVSMDWFNLMMQTDLKASEYYLLVKNSFIKSRNIKFNLNRRLPDIKDEIKNFFESPQIEILKKKFPKNLINKSLLITDSEKKMRMEFLDRYIELLNKNVQEKLKKFNEKFDPMWNIYDINQLSRNFKKKN